MNADTLFDLEIKLLVFELAMIGLWIVYAHLPIKLITACTVSLLIVCGALRPENYNSDTLNYASYAIILSLEKGAGIYLVTKLEPLHILLIALTRDFHLWLIAEGVVAMTLLWFLYFRTSYPGVFIVVCAFFATLYTSSMRFAIALLVIAAILTWKNRSLAFYAAASLLAGCAHAVMVVVGPFATRIKWMPMAFTIAFSTLALLSTDIRGRVGSDLSDVKSIGLKSFVTFLVICGFSWYKSSNRNTRQFMWDVFGFTSVFLITALLYPGLNRIIIIGGIVILFDIERKAQAERDQSYLDRLAIWVMYAMITVPYLLLVPDLYKYNMW